MVGFLGDRNVSKGDSEQGNNEQLQAWTEQSWSSSTFWETLVLGKYQGSGETRACAFFYNYLSNRKSV